MRLRTIVANGLSDLVLRELSDHPRPDHKGDHQRGYGRKHRAQRDVAEHVKRADIRCYPVGEREQHQRPPAVSSLGSPSPSTTRSIFMKREPLTSTVVPRSSTAFSSWTSEPWSSQCYLPVPYAADHGVAL